MIDFTLSTLLNSLVLVNVVHLRPPSVQAESCCDHPSTRISPGATIVSPLKSNGPANLVKPSNLPLET
ncbi:hypothetical protein N7453_006886 [Penicillium expansum]|nr:hypothetical protein N7453_006886 [Penicillium expansum]